MDGSPPSQFVVLVRHGDAMSEEQDPRRPLSAAGREHVDQVAGLVAGLSLEIEEVRHSGKERARETAEIFAARVGVAPERVREVTGLKPKDDVGVVAEELESEGRSMALVGHLPFMSLLASRLLSGDPKCLRFRFGDAGCLLVTRVEGGWRLEEFINHDLVS
jgi:phosphohistidine phosphatase